MASYKQLLEKSEAWRDELQRALVANGGTDVITDYGSVARAFPSEALHPHTFEFDFIDTQALKSWSAANDWIATPAPEKAKDPKFPPIRFRRADTSKK